MKNKMKLLIGIIPIIVISIIIHNRPISKTITVESNVYGTPANSAFKDESFYKCVIDSYNYDRDPFSSFPKLSYDDNISDEQLQNIRNLRCSGLKINWEPITNVSGIEKIINVKEINLSKNKLTSINLSNNLLLEELNISDSELTNIDLNNNVNLKVLHIYDNPLTDINLSNNVNLEELVIGDTYLKSIDLSNNIELKKLYINNDYDSYFSSIDLSKNANLSELQMTHHRLTNIDLSKNAALKKIILHNNELTNIELNNSIEEIYLYADKLANIDLSRCANLKVLILSENEISEIDLSNNMLLETLNLSENQLATVDLSNNMLLETLNLSENQLTTIDLSKNTALTHLDLERNKLTNIDISHNTALSKLNLSRNKLINIDLSKNLLLNQLNLNFNKLTNLNLGNNIELQNLYLVGNGLKELDLSNNAKLENIELFDEMENRGQIEKRYLYKDDLLYEEDDVLKRLIVENVYDTNITDFYGNQYFVYKTDTDFYYISPTHENIYYPFEYDVMYYKLLKKKDIGQLLKINDSDSYIYIGTEKNYDFISDNTYFGIKYLKENSYTTDNIPSGISVEIDDNDYIIKHNGKIIKIFKIINISSDKYDLTKNYLYGTYDEIKNNVDVANGSINLNLITNKVEIKHNDDILEEFDYIGYKSEKYDLIKDYIKVNDDQDKNMNVS